MDEELDLGFEEQILEPQPEEEPEALVRAFATVGAVYADGLSLIFDGEEEPTEKHYLCNTSVYFQAGDRVRLAKDSGTYIVEYVVGPPKQARTVGIPAGGTTGQLLTKNGSTAYAVKWADAPAARNVHNYGAAAASVIWLQFDASNGRLRVSLDHSNWRNLNFD